MMNTTGFLEFKNRVASLADAPRIVVFSRVDSGVGQQFSEEGYDIYLIYVDHEAFETHVDHVVGLLAADTSRSVGLLTYELSTTLIPAVEKLVKGTDLKAIVHYTPAIQDGSPLILRARNGSIIPTVFHLAASQEVLQASLLPCTDSSIALTAQAGPTVSVFTYPLVSASPSFGLAAKMAAVHDGQPSSVELALLSAVNMAYTRTLGIFRRVLGPWFDLEQLWDRHCYYEFNDRDALKTMATMVKVPYVNHIPVMTGGVGFHDLSLFYQGKHHFIQSSPPDTEIVPISRTVGVDRLVDEILFRFTHTTEVDYLLPGVKPTGKRVEIPMIGVIAFRGDKLTFEHIYWDQASTLVQLGLLEKQDLPVSGVEVARKMANPFAHPSNELLEKWEVTKQLKN